MLASHTSPQTHPVGAQENVPELFETVQDTMRHTVGKMWDLVKNGSSSGSSAWSRAGSGWSSAPSSEVGGCAYQRGVVGVLS